MASAPTTPSSARRGIHSWMRRGNSCNTSRQSPISSVRTEPSGFSRGRQTRWTEEASARLSPVRDTRFPISVSIGQEPVIIQPASINGLQDCFPACCRLAGENDDADAVGLSNAPAFCECFGQFAFVKCDVLCRLLQLVWTVNDDLFVFRAELDLEKIRVQMCERSLRAKRRRNPTSQRMEQRRNMAGR